MHRGLQQSPLLAPNMPESQKFHPRNLVNLLLRPPHLHGGQSSRRTLIVGIYHGDLRGHLLGIMQEDWHMLENERCDIFNYFCCNSLRPTQIEESERNFGLKPRSAVVDSLPREVPQRRPVVPQQTMPPSSGPLVEPRAEDTQVNNVDQLQDQLDPRYEDMPLETDAAEFDSHDNRNKRVSPKPKSRTSIVQELEQRRAVPLVNPRFNNPDKPKHGATQNKLSLVQKRLEDRQQHKRVPKMLQKTVKADVYIPSVVSVGALAQLLNVRLRE